MKNFITGAIKKSRTSLSILVLLGLSGVFALNYLPKATEPQVSFPGAYVGVGFEGVSPEDSERLLAKPLEDALRTISGVVDVSCAISPAQFGFELFFERICIDVLRHGHMVGRCNIIFRKRWCCTKMY